MTVGLDSLAPLEQAGRAVGVRERLDAAGCEALLVTDLTNVRWLTGFTGSNGWVVVSAERLTLVTDGRYTAQAAQQLGAAGVDADVVEARTGARMIELVAAMVAGADRLGIEAADVTVQLHERLTGSLPNTLVNTIGVVESGRRTKDAGEIDRIALAADIADRALATVVATLRAGVTEVEVRDELEREMRRLGASGPSYETIVAAGTTNAALAHHRPCPTRLQHGDTVIIDVGALVDGYHSDMTRTFVIGEPSARQSELYALVLDAQRAGVAAVRAGVTTAALDAACRDRIAAAGLGDWFVHGTGHGVGLLIHEDPFVGPSSDAVLQVGDVVTVEPGVYRGGFGGIRIEDLLVVTPDGCRNLTGSPKETPCPPSPPTT